MRRDVRGGDRLSRERVPRTGPRLHLERLEGRVVLCATHLFDGLIEPSAVVDGFGVKSLSAAGDLPGSAAESFAVSLASTTGTLSSDADGVGNASAVAANGLPLLYGLPSAPTAIYLDFDGEGSNAPYDVDGNSATFNATEAATITEVQLAHLACLAV